MKVEAFLNAPGFIVLYIVGPGHGIPQLVLPFVFSVLFYFAAFWCLLTVFGRLRAGVRSGLENADSITTQGHPKSRL